MALDNGEGTNMVMPVSPMYGNVNSGYGGFNGCDGGLFWIIILFLFMFSGYGNGWGGFGGGNNGGATIPTSRAIVTPTVADAYFNVTSTAIVDIPVGCCPNVSVRNVSTSTDPATTPAPTINMQNANLVITRVA